MLSESLTVLRAAYPRASFPPETVTLYAELLSDLPEQEVAEACRRIIRRSMYLPSVAEIRREVMEARHDWPSPGEAWEIVTSGRAFDHACEPLRDAYRAMGGSWALRTTTNIGAMRHGFERDYDQRVERRILEDMGARLPALPPAQQRALAADVPSTPVERRMAKRFLGEPMGPPTDEEKRDAIRVIGEDMGGWNPKGDAIHCEAERIFAEGAS